MQRYLTSLFVVLCMLCAAAAYYLTAPSSDAVVEQEPVTAEEKAKREPQEINFDLVRRIHCSGEDGSGGLGTAWIIDEGTLVTAAHVASGKNCYDIETLKPIEVVYVDWHNDFALLKMETGPLLEYISYSCEGFRTNQHYMAVGWAGDGESTDVYKRQRLRQTQIWAQGFITDKNTRFEDMRAIGLRFLTGVTHPGMSGGPVFDDHGVAVGINSAAGPDKRVFSRDLRDTILCGEPRKNDAKYSDIFRD